MEQIYRLNVWLHLLMVTVWVGGLIYTAAVVVPYAVSRSEEERRTVLRGLARRFRWIGWGSIVVLVVTGLGNLLLRPTPISLSMLLSGAAFDPDRVGQPIATWLPWKLGLVVTMVVLMLFHDISSTRAGRSHERAADTGARHSRGSFAAALATILAIGVLYVSVRLVRG